MYIDKLKLYLFLLSPLNLYKTARRNNYISYSMLVQAGADEKLRNSIRETPKQLLNDDITY